MGSQDLPSHSDITLDKFNELLAKYPAVIKVVSDAKGAKDGQKSLAALDEHRYVEAPALFGKTKGGKRMGLEDVKLLVEWKLRHGKFRPTLMKLVSSNDPKTTETTIQEAVKTYRTSSSAPSAVDALAKLKGVGPATASLLLAVHDPINVPFFSDEIFYWLCCDAKVAPIKYNAKEYRDLDARMQGLSKRLNVKAVDAERVAFVLFRGDSLTTPVESEEKDSVPKTAPDKKTSAQPPKRKPPSSEASEASGPVRRSKRGKQA